MLVLRVLGDFRHVCFFYGLWHPQEVGTILKNWQEMVKNASKRRNMDFLRIRGDFWISGTQTLFFFVFICSLDRF